MDFINSFDTKAYREFQRKMEAEIYSESAEIPQEVWDKLKKGDNTMPKKEKSKTETTFKKDSDFLRVILTEKEMLAAAKESSMALLKINRLESDLKSINKKFKADIEVGKLTMQNNAKLVEDGYEYRTVECRWAMNWGKGVKSMMRMDTMKIIKKDVKIEDSERQEEIKMVK